MSNTRAPNWSKWRAVPDVKIWEGVALSLDIEPDDVKHSGRSWMVDEHLFDESKEFRDRIFVATRNIGKGLRAIGLVIGDPASAKVSLTQFIDWALTLNWSMPGQLRRLSPNQQSTLPIRDDVQLFPGGLTWVDAHYDENLKAALEREQADKSAGSAASTSASGETRRTGTLLRLVLAMAKAKYGWSPDKRNTATGEKGGSIYADVIAQLGEGRKVDADTIRIILEQANEDFPGRD